jgi:hypothetical protein
VKSGMQKGGQELSQGVNDRMGHVLRAGTELKHRQNLGTGIEGQPEPQHLGGAAQSGANFVQLQVRKMQVAEGVLMQELSVPACTSEPPGNRGVSKAENPLGRGRVEPFGQRREHDGDLLRGGFQPVQRRVASRTEGGVALLAAKRLDALSAAMLAIPNQSMPSSISVAKVRALPVRTGEPFGVDPLGGSPSAFYLRPRTYRLRCWPSTHRESGGQTTSGAIVWRAGLQETVERAALGSSS